MNRINLFVGVSVISLSLAASVASPAYAWHPKGTIQKSVQNVTTSSAISDANDTTTAVAAKPGDTLKYVITVSNTGAADSKGYNDMAKTMLTDSLPVGVELTSSAASRTIQENLGTIKPGESVTREYLVKVTATTNSTITNKACFTGDSTVNDNPQAGCDTAIVTVKVPVIPPTVTTTSPPSTPAPVETPTPTPVATELPSTGPASLVAPVLVASVLGYIGRRMVQKRQYA